MRFHRMESIHRRDGEVAESLRLLPLKIGKKDRVFGNGVEL